MEITTILVKVYRYEVYVAIKVTEIIKSDLGDWD